MVTANVTCTRNQGDAAWSTMHEHYKPTAFSLTFSGVVANEVPQSQRSLTTEA